MILIGVDKYQRDSCSYLATTNAQIQPTIDLVVIFVIVVVLRPQFQLSKRPGSCRENMTNNLSGIFVDWFVFAIGEVVFRKRNRFSKKHRLFKKSIRYSIPYITSFNKTSTGNRNIQDTHSSIDSL